MIEWRILLLLAFLAQACLATEPLKSLAELRALSHGAASLAVPVEVEGIVVGLEPSAPFHFFLHDGTAGCFIKTTLSGRVGKLVVGDRVRVSGVSDPLGYYPSVKNGHVKILGKSALPLPSTPTASQMFAPELDSEWIEVPAVVTAFELTGDRVTLVLEVHGLPFKAELPMSDDAENQAVALLQRPVRLRGVMGTIFNRQRQMTDRHFFVSSFASLVPTMPKLTAEVSPLLSVTTLLTGGYGPRALVRVQGRVTQLDDLGFYLRDGTGSTLIHAARVDHLAPGAVVEVEGYGAVAPFRPILRAVRVTEFDASESLLPVSLDLGKSDLSMLHGEWVTLDADFLGRRDGPLEGVLQFRSGERFFEALHPNRSESVYHDLVIGDRLRLTGINELTTTHALPRPDWIDGFRILLPESGGIQVLRRAPWWTTQRLLIALGAASALAVLGMIGTWILRRQVKSQMAVISDQLRAEAVGEERDRMARELHDTLEQQLSGVALQLDGLDYAVNQNPATASSILSLARRMLRYTRLEARRSVWDLRSKVLENEGLAAALRAISSPSGGGFGPAVEVRVSGKPSALVTGVDFHLLRIAQEAMTNAVKHGSAESIMVHLDYQVEHTCLTVHDDGQGFDATSPQSAPGPHFGLLGMRERAAKIMAELSIVSAPGCGCTVKVEVPNQLSFSNL